MKTIVSLLLSAMALALSACGGGGTSAPPSNSHLLSFNPTAITVNVATFPNDGYSYGDSTIEFGKFGSTTANCFVAQTTTRARGGASSSKIPDAPFFIMCQQLDGTFKEVSEQLLGKKYYINGGYPLVADFNNDGVDDLFLINAFDGGEASTYQIVFISNPDGSYTKNQFAIKGLNGPFTGTSGAIASDINHDGCLDLVMNVQIAMLGDCSGNFTQQFIARGANAKYAWGSNLCAGDFNNMGHDQYVFIDTSSPVPSMNVNPPNNILEIDPITFGISNIYPLPIPFWNTVYGANDGSHNVKCLVADINNDGKPDIFIFTRPWSSYTGGIWGPQSYVQIYLNKGNFQFEDISATALPGYVTNTGSSYSPRLIDVNSDGYLDLVLEGGSWEGAKKNGNQIWLNNRNNTFTKVFTTELTTIQSAFRAAYGMGQGDRYEANMLPIRVNGGYNYITGMQDFSGVFHIGVANTQYVFR